MPANSAHVVADGYFTVSDYVPTWQPELAPAWLDHVATDAGLAAPRLRAGAPFRYCEIGCGLGWTLNLLAAANPEGRFVGIDAMAGQVRQARAVARAAGLTNVRFVHATLAQVRERRFPRCHYITAHGVYTWVSDDNADHLFDFAARVLLPGGLCYLGYNVEPGWSALRPAQHLLQSAALHLPASPTTPPIDGAVALLRQARAAAGEGFGLTAQAARLLDDLLALPRAYLGHEFLNAHWRPVFVTEAHARAQRVGLSYVASARPALRRPDYLLRRDQRALVDAQPPGPLRELVQDVCLAQMFRADVFVKHGTPLSLTAQRKRRTTGTYALCQPPAEVAYAVQTPAGRLRFEQRAVRVLVRALAAGPCRAIDVARRVARHGCRMSELLAAQDLLLFSGAIVPVDPRKRAPRAAALNAVLRAHALTRTNPLSHGSPPQLGRHGTAWQVTTLDLLLLGHAGDSAPRLRDVLATLDAHSVDLACIVGGAPGRAAQHMLRARLRQWPARQRWLRGLGVR